MTNHHRVIIATLTIVTIGLGCAIISDVDNVSPNDNDITPIVISNQVENFEKEVEIEKEPIFNLSEYERWVVECIVMGEAKGESYEGKALVAQCILNACLREDIQPSEVRIEYKYAGWNEAPSDEVKEVVSAVFDDGYQVTSEQILYFYAPKVCNSAWHETQRYVITEGGHKFFALWED